MKFYQVTLRINATIEYKNWRGKVKVRHAFENARRKYVKGEFEELANYHKSKNLELKTECEKYLQLCLDHAQQTGKKFDLIDLPGIHSLVKEIMEELWQWVDCSGNVVNMTFEHEGSLRELTAKEAIENFSVNDIASVFSAAEVLS